MSGHPTVRDDPDDVMVRRAATVGHRTALIESLPGFCALPFEFEYRPPVWG